ncbi:hypothetical protein [Caulobacter sp. 1776]|uniref:hypothetical protein n=1 Tax=Caulobacter sp. 1776 TaxID=3156420 RepID=UPI003394A0A5
MALSNDLRPENKALVVILTALQLAVVVAVWMLAIVPAGLLALAVLARKAIRTGLKGEAR